MKTARVYSPKLYPAAVYATPAVAPLFVGVNQATGLAQRQSTSMYKYTLQQMAVSPYSVNSQEYMERIRKEYGYSDTGMYDAMGYVGTIVGTGAGAYIGLGGWRGFRNAQGAWQVPFQKIPKDTISKRQYTSRYFRKDTSGYKALQNVAPTEVSNYESSRIASNTAKKNFNKFTSQFDEDVIENFKQYKIYQDTINDTLTELEILDSNIATAQEAGGDVSELLVEQTNLRNRLGDVTAAQKELNVNIENYNKYIELEKLNTNAATKFSTDTRALQKTVASYASQSDEALDAAGLAIKSSAKTIDGVVSAGKPLAKIAGSFTSVAGTAIDVASLGVNIVGIKQSVEESNYLFTALYAASALGDVASIVGDALVAAGGSASATVIGAVPGASLAGIGYLVNILGSISSAVYSGIIGLLSGSTVGHSLSPEGVKAQSLFASNLYSSMINRPISTIATLGTLFVVPAVLNTIGVPTLGKKWYNKVANATWRNPKLIGINRFLTGTAVGNYVRSASTMMAMRAIQPVSTKLDEKLPWAPGDPEDVNFVSMFSLYGDIQDNLYGATNVKSSLLGLASKDSSVAVKALARSWGYSDNIYYSVMADDVRQAAGIDIGNFGNSVLSTIGEILVDPQNLTEVAYTGTLRRTTEAFASHVSSELKLYYARFLAGQEIPNAIKKLLFEYDGEKIKEVDSKVVTTPIANAILIGDKNVISRYLESWLKGGKKSVRETHLNYSTQFIKGSSFKVTTDTSFGKFADHFDTYLNETVQGKYTTTSDDLNALQQTLNKFASASEDDRLLDAYTNAKKAFDYIYNTTHTENDGLSDLDIIAKFIDEFHINVNSKQLKQLYDAHTGFRNYMDLIEQTGSVIQTVANPIQFAVKKFSRPARNFFERLRAVVDPKQAARTIVTMKELEDNIDKILDTETVEKTRKEQDELNNRIRAHIDRVKTLDISEEDKVELDTHINTISAEFATERERVQEVLNKSVEQIKDLEQYQREQSLRTYAITDRRGKILITINKDNADDIKKTIDEFETSPDGRKLTDAEIKAKCKRLGMYSAEVQTYKSSVQAYYMFNMTAGMQKLYIKLHKNLSSVILLLDTLSLSAQEKLINFITKYTTTVTLYNHVEKITADEIKTKIKEFYDKEYETLTSLLKRRDELLDKPELSDDEVQELTSIRVSIKETREKIAKGYMYEKINVSTVYNKIKNLEQQKEILEDKRKTFKKKYHTKEGSAKVRELNDSLKPLQDKYNALKTEYESIKATADKATITSYLSRLGKLNAEIKDKKKDIQYYKQGKHTVESTPYDERIATLDAQIKHNKKILDNLEITDEAIKTFKEDLYRENNEDATTVEAMLAQYGVHVYDENGKPTTTGWLKTFRHNPKSSGLQINFKYTFQDVLISAINTALLKYTDTIPLTTYSANDLDYTYAQWSSLKSPEEKRKVVRILLLDKVYKHGDVIYLDNPKNLDKIVELIDITYREAAVKDGVISEYVSLNELSVNDIRNYIMKEMLQVDSNKEIYTTAINVLKDTEDVIDKVYKSLDENADEKVRDTYKYMIKDAVSEYTRVLKNTTVYDYIYAYLRKDNNINTRKDLKFIMQPSSLFNILPSINLQDVREDLKHNNINGITSTLEAITKSEPYKMVKNRLKTVETMDAYNEQRKASKIAEEAEEADTKSDAEKLLEERNKAKEIYLKEKAQVQNIYEHYEKETSAFLQNKKKVKSKMRVSTKLSNIKDLPEFFKAITKKFYLDYDINGADIEIHPEEALIINENKVSKFDTLTKNKPIHGRRSVVKHLVKYLYSKYNKVGYIDENGKKIPLKESKTAITRYLQGHSLYVHIDAKKTKQGKLVNDTSSYVIKTYRSYLWQVLYKYRDTDDLFKNMREASAQDVLNYLIKTNDKTLLQKIHKETYTKTHEALAYSHKFEDIAEYTEPLEAFEKNIIKSVAKGGVVLDTQYIKRVAYNEASFADMLQDIFDLPYLIEHPEINCKTMLGEVLRLINNGVTETLKSKEKYNYTDYATIEYKDGQYYIVKQNGTKLDLFTFLYKHHFNYVTFQAFVTEKYTGDNKPAFISNIMNEYNKLLEEYGDMLYIDTFAESKEIFIKMYEDDKHSKEELESIYNYLTSHWVVKSYIESLQTRTRDIKYFEKVDNKYVFEILFSQDMRNIYQKTIREEPEDFLAKLMFNILHSNIDNKEYILQHIFFPDVKIAAGRANMKNIKGLEAGITKIDARLQDTTLTDIQRKRLEVSKQILNNKKKLFIEINNDIKYNFLREDDPIDLDVTKLEQDDAEEYIENALKDNVAIDYNKFFEYLSKLTYDEVAAIYNNTVRTSDATRFVYAKSGDEYVITTSDNVTSVSKGAPGINKRIFKIYEYGEIVDKNIKIDDVDAWKEFEDKGAHVAYTTDNDAVVICDDITLREQIQSSLKSKFKRIYVVTQKEFTEIKDMQGNVSDQYEYVIKDPEKTILNIINVKGSKVVAPSFNNDFIHVRNHKLNTEDIIKYYDTATQYAMIPKGMLTGHTLIHTTLYNKLKHQIEITKAHKEFLDWFKNDDGTYKYDINVLNEFFTDAFMSKTKNTFSIDDIPEYVKTHYPLSQTNELISLLKDAISDIRERYDIHIDTEPLSGDMIDTLLNLTNIAGKFVEKLRTANLLSSEMVDKLETTHRKFPLYDQGVLITEHHNELRNIQKNIFGDSAQQSLHESPTKWVDTVIDEYTKYKDDAINILKDIKQKHKTIKTGYFSKSKQLNYKTTYFVLDTIEKVYRSKEPLNFYTGQYPEALKVIITNEVQPLLNSVLSYILPEWAKIDKESITIKDAYGVERVINSAEEYASYIIFTDIIYPYIQNIGTKFAFTDSQSLYYSAFNEEFQAYYNMHTNIDLGSDESLYTYADNTLRRYVELLNDKKIKPSDICKFIKTSIDTLKTHTFAGNILPKSIIYGILEPYFTYIETAVGKGIFTKDIENVFGGTLGLIQNIIMQEYDEKVQDYMNDVRKKLDLMQQRKGINYIEKSDRKRYEYVSNDLRRTGLFIYINKKGLGTTDERFENAPSIASYVKDTYMPNSSEVSKAQLHKVVDSIVDKLEVIMTTYPRTQVYAKTMEQQDADIEQILTDNNIYNLTKLWEYLFADEEHQKLARIISSISPTKKYDPEYLDNLLKKCFGTTDPSEDQIKLFNEVSNKIYSNRHLIKAVIDRFKHQHLSFEKPQQLISLTNTDALNRDKDFYAYAVNYINKTKGLNRRLGLYTPENIVTNRAYEIFTESKTLEEFYDRYNYYLRSYDFKEVQSKYFALVLLINELKVSYINKTYKEDLGVVINGQYEQKIRSSNPTYWFHTLRRTDDATRAELYKDVKAMEFAQVFSEDSSVYGSNIVRAMYAPMYNIKRMRTHIKAVNNDLSRMVYTVLPKGTTDPLKEKSTHIVPNNMETIKRQVHNYMVEPLFKDRQSPDLSQKIISSITAELSNAVYDTYAEMMASTVDTVGSTSTTYNAVRKLFTNIYRYLYTEFDERNFIHIYQVTTALRMLQSGESSYYLNTFNLITTQQKMNMSEEEQQKYDTGINKAINEVVKYFNNSTHLVDLNKDRVKAILGYVWFNTNKTKESAINKLEDFQKYNIEKWQRTHTVYGIKSKSTINTIYSIINSTLSVGEKLERLSKIYYGKDSYELDEDKRNNLNKLITLSLPQTEVYIRKPHMQLWDTLTIARLGDLPDIQTFYNESNEMLYTQGEINNLQKTIAKKNHDIDTNEKYIENYKHPKLNTPKDITGDATFNKEKNLIKKVNALYEILDTIDKQLHNEKQKYNANLRKSMYEFIEGTSMYTEYIEYIMGTYKENIDKAQEKLDGIINKKSNLKCYNELISRIKHQFETYIIPRTSKKFFLFTMIRNEYPDLNVDVNKVIFDYQKELAALSINTVESLKQFMQDQKEFAEKLDKYATPEALFKYNVNGEEEPLQYKLTKKHLAYVKNLRADYERYSKTIYINNEKYKDADETYTEIKNKTLKYEDLKESTLWAIFKFHVKRIKAKSLEEVKSKIKHSNKQITENLSNAIDILYNHPDISEDSIEALLPYKRGEEYKKLTNRKNEIEKYLDNANNYLNKIAKQDADKKELEKLENDLETAKALKKEQQEIFNAAAMRYRNIAKKGTRTNIGLYKTSYGLVGKTTTEVIEDLKKRIINDGLMTEEELSKVLGANELHNPVIDCLITMYNYKFQQGKFPEKFYVMDMETVKDEQGQDTPYQLTLVQYVEGKIKVYNAYYNNSVFYDIDAHGEYGDFLQAFYDQQKQIWMQDDEELQTIKDEDERTAYIDKKFKQLLNTVKLQHNSLAVTEMFISMLTTADCPIVAHNGDKFDFVNYDKFISTIARRLLINEYYHTYTQNAPNEILTRLTNEMPNESAAAIKVSKEYEQKLKEALTELTSKEITDRNTYNKIYNIVDDIFEELIRIRAASELKEIQESKGIYTDANIVDKIFSDENGDYLKIYNTMWDYIQKGLDITTCRSKLKEIFNDMFPDQSESEKNYLDEYITDLIEHVYNTYNTYYNSDTLLKYDTNAKEYIIKGTLDKLLMNNKDKLSYHTRINALNVTIETLEQALNMFDNQLRSQYLQYTENYKEEHSKLELAISQLNEKINTYEQDILNAEQTSQEYIDKLKPLAKEIQKIINNRVSAVTRTLNNIKVNHLSSNQTIADIGGAIETLYNSIKYDLTILDNIVKAIEKNEDTNEMFLKFTMIPEIMEIKDENTKTKVSEIITNRLQELQEYKQIINEYQYYNPKLTELLNNYKQKKLNENELYYKQIKDLIETLKLEGLPEITDLESLQQFKDVLSKIIKTDKRNEIKKIIDIVNVKGPLQKNFEILKVLDTPNRKELKEQLPIIKENILTYLDNEIAIQTKSQAFVNTITFDSDVNNKFTKDIEKVKLLSNEILSKLYTSQESIQKLNDEVILLSGFTNKKNSELPKTDVSITYDKELKEKFEYAAETYAEDSPEVQSLYDATGVTRVYQNTSENNNKYGLRRNSNYYWKADNVTTGYTTISTYDEVYDTDQKLIMPSNDINTWKVEVTYVYHRKGLELHKPQHIKRSLKVHEFISMIENDKFFDIAEGVTKGINRDLISHLNQTDSSYESIYKLYKFLKETNLSYEKIIKHDLLVDKYKIGLNKMKLVNLTEECNQQFMYWTNVINLAKQGEFGYTNLSEIYNGIYNRIIGKYSASDPGKILNCISSDYAYDYIYDLTPEDMKQLGINPAEASEGSMGLSFILTNVYSVDPSFSLNTNSVRSVLSSGVIRAKFTPIGVINEYYKLTKNGKITNLTEYINKDIDERITQQIEEETKDWKNEKQIEEYKKYRREQLEKYENLRAKRLLHEYEEGKLREEFTPNVGAEDLMVRYSEDVLHRTGLNTKVAFINLPAAFEDVILVDEDFAKAMGWAEGNKTWAGPGFKGGVKYVEGLHDMLGCNFAASAASIMKRGAYGVHVEMMLNTILDYNLSIDTSINSKLTQKQKDWINNIPRYNTTDEVKDKTVPLYIVAGKLYTQPNIDWDAMFKKVFGDNWINIITHKVTKDITMPVYVSPTDSKVELTPDNIKNIQVQGLEYWKGTMYVRMDAEHFASHMQVKPVLQADEDDNLTYVTRDSRGSIHKGGMISYTIDQVLMQKVGANWRDVFLTDDTTKRLRDTQTFVFINGFDKFELVHKEGIIDINATLQKAKETYFMDSIEKDFIAYLSLKNKYILSTDKDSFEYLISKTNIRAKNKALNDLKGSRGTINRVSYQRHDAVRAQMLANVTLAPGEIKLPYEEMQQLLKSKSQTSWARNEVIKNTYSSAKQDTLEDRLTLYKQLINNGIYSTIYNEKGEAQENYILHGAKYRKVQGIEQLVYVEKIEFKDTLYQTIAYTMAIRTPVQDYNATPIVKVVGAVDHAAVECNAYIYTMMGGDNDGDTAVFLPVNHKHVEDGLVKDLDSTKIKYYDKGYIQKRINGELGLSDKLKLQDASKGYVSGDMRYAFIGKKTVPGGVRGETPHYTYYELYKPADSSLIKELKTLTKDVKLNTLVEEDKDPEKTYKFWVNVYIRDITQGSNTAENFESEDMYKTHAKEYYEAHKEEIDQIRRIETYLQTTDTSEIITHSKTKYKDTMEFILHVRDVATCSTLMRGRLSKLGVGFMGGQRKNQNLGTTVSTFTEMNRDASGKIWNTAYNIGWDANKNKATYITVEDLMRTVLANYAHVLTIDKSEEEIRKELKVKSYIQDNIEQYKKEYNLNEILDFIAHTLYNRQCVIKEIKSIYKICNEKELTYQTVYDHFTTCSAKNNDWVKTFIKAIKYRLKETVEVPHKEMIKAFYFGRFQSTFDKQKSAEKALEYYKDQYVKQYIVTRPLSSQINNMAQTPISLSKHGGIGMDIAKLHRDYMKEIKELTDKIAIRQINISGDLEHDRSFAMAMDYDYFEKHTEIKFEDEYKSQRTKYAEDYNNALNISYTSNVTSQVKVAIDYIMNTEVLNIPSLKIYKDSVKESIIEVQKTLKEIQNNFSLLVSNKKALDNLYKHIINLQTYGVPFYRIIYGIIDSLSMLSKVNSEWLNSYNNTSKQEIYKSSIDVLANCKNMFSLNYKIYNDRSGFEASLGYLYNYNDNKLNTVLDWILGKDELDPNLMLLDGDIKTIDTTDTDSNYLIRRKNSRLDYFEELESGRLPDPDSYTRTKRTMLNNAITETFLDDINFDTNKKDYTVEDLVKVKLTEINKQIDLLQMQYSNYDAFKNTLKNAHTQEEEITNIIKEYGFGGQILSPKLRDVTTIVHDIQDKKAFINKARYEISKMKNKEIEIKQKIDALENTYKLIKNNLDDDNLKERLEKELAQAKESLDIIKHRLLKASLSENLGSMIGALRTGDGEKIQDGKLVPAKPKLLTPKDIKQFQNSLIMQLDKYQTPIEYVFNMFTDGEGNVDYKEMFKALDKYHKYLRVTVLMKPFDDEGLIKNLNDYFTKELEVSKELSPKEQKKYIKEHIEDTKFKSLDDLKVFLKTITKGVRINDKVFEGVDNLLFTEDELNNLDNFITPTLKEIKLKSYKDLIRLHKIVKENKYVIGITGLDKIMDAMETAYKPYKIQDFKSGLIGSFNITQKAIMRFSSGFLLRNAIDTMAQLISEQQQHGNLLLQAKEMVYYFNKSMQIFELYKLLSEERMFTLSEILLDYNDIQHLLTSKTIDTETIDAKIERMLYRLEVYIKYSDTDINRINKRKASAIRIQKEINKIQSKLKDSPQLYKEILTSNKTLYQLTKFLTNIEFAEYYRMYEGLRITNDVQKVDNKLVKSYNKISSIIANQTNLKEFESMLFEISAFMQTQAQVDMFKQKQYKDLEALAATYKNNILELDKEKELDQIIKEVDNARKESITDLREWLDSTVLKPYHKMTEWTENMARIVGFIYNRNINQKSFGESVNLSLRSWFNYGQQSPLEKQLMFDIPYISFPIRSIDNWIERMLNPKFARLMDDIIDGVYGQYADEDGQYSEWEQFMISNGWIPIGKGIGIRGGSGVFDIQNLLTDTTNNVSLRMNPMLRALATYAKTHNVKQAVQETAIAGTINRATKVSQQKTLSMFFRYNEYEKYTPYKYRNDNARWIYYENIYRDWFNKYGRMRKPTVDPYQLVKTIKWKQFVRYKQNQYRR